MPIDMRMILAGHRADSPHARQISEAGIEVRRLDYMDPVSIDESLRGVHKVLIISTYDTNDVRVIQHANIVDDGKRFLFVMPTSEVATAPFKVVLNWTSLLKR